jgi:hypothetical protein
VTRWPRRLQPVPAGLPKPLQEFVDADWQEWLLDGPDPAASAYKDGDVERFYRLHAHRGPRWAATYRRLDAHKRWTAARRAWLEAHGHADLAFDWWIDDVAYEHRVLQRELRELSP